MVVWSFTRQDLSEQAQKGAGRQARRTCHNVSIKASPDLEQDAYLEHDATKGINVALCRWKGLGCLPVSVSVFISFRRPKQLGCSPAERAFDLVRQCK